MSAATREADLPGTLRAARARAGLSVRAVARAAGLSIAAVWQCEQGAYRPRLATLHALAVALDLDPHALDQRLAPRRPE
jgi:transcriptional regulator with XRE-family HTH domain